MKKILSTLLAAAMLTTALAGCGGDNGAAAGGDNTGAAAGGDNAGAPAAAGAAFKVGGTGPLTGDAAIYGNAVKNGAEIAVAEINAMGGIQFELKMQDDENDAEKAVNAYYALKDWGVQMTLGSVTSTPGAATAAEQFTDRIFALTPSASSTAVIDSKDNVFQMCFVDPNQGLASARYISDNKLGTKVAVIYKNDDVYSSGIYETFKTEAASLGLEVVSATTFTSGSQNDFSVQLGEAKKAGADLIFLPIYYQPASMILTQAKGMDYAPKIFGVDGMDGILTMDNFDTTLAEGVMLLTPFNADATDELTTKFVTTYKEKFGVVPNQFAADAYDCIYAYKAALEKAGCTPDMSAQDINDKMIEAFPTISIDGLTGAGMTWDATGAVSKEPKGMIIQNGAYVGM